MEKYIEQIYNTLVPENKGFIFIGTEDLYFPIFKVSLSITKRKHISLNLIEEMVLRIIEKNVTNVDEIAGVLGLEKSLLDVTISDLFVKSLVYQSCGVCTLTAPGREAIQELETVKKEKDSVDNIYINPFNNEITTSFERLISHCNQDDRKVKISFDCEHLAYYISNMSKIREIFDNQNLVYTVRSNQVPDELLSIDSVEDSFVSFSKIPVYIYISEVGKDIDIIPCDKKLIKFIDAVKLEIIRQIRDEKLLKNIFAYKYKGQYSIPQGQYRDQRETEELINSYYKDKEKTTEKLLSLKRSLLQSRILLDNEFYQIFEFLIKEEDHIEFHIENLDYWSKENIFITMLTMIDRKSSFDIYYNSVGNFDRSIKRLNNSIPGLNKKRIKQEKHDYWLKISTSKYEIIGVPYYYEVFNNALLIKKLFYLNIKEAN